MSNSFIFYDQKKEKNMKAYVTLLSINILQ